MAYLMEQNIFNNKYTLVRFFQEEEYVETFRCGKIRMMSAKYYKKNEEKSKELYNNRYDAFENSNYIYNPNLDGTIQFAEPIGRERFTNMWVNPNVLCSPIIIDNDKLDELTKISCFYILPIHNSPYKKLSSYVSNKVYNFGNYYCLIINQIEFENRIKNGIIKYHNQKITSGECFGPVEYIDEKNFNGKYGPFRKPSGLSWQNEYRIRVVTQDNNEPFWFEVDNLKDITIWGKTSELLDGMFNESGGLIISNYNS